MPNIRKPTKIKELSGNPGKRALPKNEPQGKGKPKAPKALSKPARIIFDELVNSMPPGVYTGLDTYLLGAYAEAAALWAEATQYFTDGGLKITKGSMGQEVISPWVKIQSDNARMMVQIGAKLGLDPASRQSLNTPDEDTDANPFIFN